MPLIGVDTRGLEKSFKAHFGRGTGRYIAELVPRLEELCQSSASNNIKIRRLGLNELAVNGWQKELLDCVKIRIIQRLFLIICIIKIICKRIGCKNHTNRTAK